MNEWFAAPAGLEGVPFSDAAVLHSVINFSDYLCRCLIIRLALVLGTKCNSLDALVLILAGHIQTNNRSCFHAY